MIDVTSMKKIMTSSNGLITALVILCLIYQASAQQDDTSKQPLTLTDNADKRFDSNPLAGLPGAEDEKPVDLPILNRVKKVPDSKNLQPNLDSRNIRLKRKDDQPDPGYFFYRNQQTLQNYKAPEEFQNPEPVQKIAEFPIFRENVENKILRHKRNDDDENDESAESYNSGIQYRAYGEAGTGRSAGGTPTRPPKPKAKKSGPALTSTTSRPAEYAPQIDENFVSTLFKNPEAVKMVFDYLEEKKAFTTTTKAPRQTPKPTQKSKIPSLASTFTSAPIPQPPKKPLSANQANINRLNSLFGLALLSQTGDNNNDNKKNDNDGNRDPQAAPQRAETKRPDNKRPDNKRTDNKRPDIPSLASIFGAFEQPPPKRPENVNNPLMTGEQKPDFQFFGPSDFVPKSQYSLPVHTNGPMRLKYVSAADFPYNTKFGIVPIPR